MEPGGATGTGWHVVAVLELALAVGGADPEAVLTVRRVPPVDPLAPRVCAQRVREGGIVPRTVVDLYLDPGDAARRCPRHPRHRDGRRPQRRLRARYVDAGLGFYGTLLRP